MVMGVAMDRVIVALTAGEGVLTGRLVGVRVLGCGLAQAANRVSAMKRTREWEVVISSGRWTRRRGIGASAETYPWSESNARLRLRRPPLYPLSYRGT